ncbi:MAG: hypothetical protein SFV81_18690 [Pirellulaceae bacterium]|nr:hypothetical protein [Pirellulaceae bacterium]
MNLRECLFLLPGYGLDDFPRSLGSDQANELLAGWVALWHPQLIAAIRTAPRWQQATYPPADLNDLLLVLPSISESVLKSGFHDEVTAAGSIMLRARAPWTEFQSELLSSTGLTASNATIDSLRQDFAALGYAFLQVQLMTRQLRYTSNLDELLFSDQALQAAQAAVADDRETAERMLQSCFDQLGQERDHYYSLDVNLIDVTLLAPTTLGNSLKKQLSTTHPPTSVLANASLVGKLSTAQPDSMQLLNAAFEQRSATLVGGLDQERPHPLMSFDAVRRDLMRARQAYAAWGIPQPKVFSRYTFGVVPDMPLHLRRSGFVGCMLIAWDNGIYPQGSQAKISWEATDGTFLPALAPKVIDAADPSSYLVLGLRTGELLDREQVPAMVLAHWPNRYCDYFHLLVAITKRTPALGKWMLADDFFENTDPSYHQERFTPGQFRHDWLQATSPLSIAQFFQRTQAYQRLHSLANTLQNLANLGYQLEHYHKVPATQPNTASDTETQTATYIGAPLSDWAGQLAVLWDRIDALLEPTTADSEVMAIEEQLVAVRSDLVQRLVRHLAPSTKPISADQVGQAPEVARLALNPYNCATRLTLRSNTKQTLAPESSCLHASGTVGGENIALVDVPQFGFVLSAVTAAAGVKSKQRSLAETGGLLQNEFLEAQIDSQRGHLRSLHIPGRRGNRFSFSVARRQVNGKEFQHSEMKADSVETIVNSNVFSSIRSRGQLLEQGQSVGKFQLDFSTTRGSRVLEVAIRLHDLRPLADDPWKSAYVLRFAWPTESAILRSFASGAREAWAGGVTIAPQLIEIDETDYRTHLLTAGLAFHRRVEGRFLETLLAVQGQSEVTHRFGIAVDLPYPQQSAAQFMDREFDLALTATSPITARSSWLYSVDAKNTKLDLECPLVNSEGQLVGQRFRLAETESKTVNAVLRSSRDVSEAYRVDNLGGRIGKLTATGDSCTIGLRANERVLVDVLWKA